MMDDPGGGGKPPAQNGKELLDRFKRRKIADGEDISKNQALDSGKSTQSCVSCIDSVKFGSEDVEMSNETFKYRYDEDHKGPFIFYVDSYDKSGMRKYLNGITVSSLLIRLGIKGILEVVKIGYGRCKITCKSFDVANALAEDSRLISEGLTPKIFAHFVSKVGIVFDIPTDISEEEFMEYVQSPVEVIRCIRLYRKQRNQSGKVKREPSKSMKVIFKGNSVPNEIIVGYMRVPVRNFVPFSQCFKCFRFNHFALHCKQEFDLCRDCFNRHSKDSSCGNIVCVNCKSDHAPINRNCPARAKAFAIRKIMTMENLSIKEARLRYSYAFSNRFELLEDNATDFPPLGKDISKFPKSNHHQEAVSDLHKILPYSKVLKNNTNRIREEAKAKETLRVHNEILKDHEIRLPYNRTTFKKASGEGNSSQGSKSSSLLSKESNSHSLAIEVFISKDTTEALFSLSSDDMDVVKLRELLYSIRDNISRSMNFLDVDRIRRSLSNTGGN